MKRETPQQMHFRCKGLKMETINSIGQFYSVTITMSDLRDIDTGRANSVQVGNNFEKKLSPQLVLLRKLHSCGMELYPELSPTGLLHYHGVLEVKDIFKFYWHDLYILNQYHYEIDTIGDMSKWMAYCKKQQRIMKPELEVLAFQYPIEINGGVNWPPESEFFRKKDKPRKTAKVYFNRDDDANKLIIE